MKSWIIMGVGELREILLQNTKISIAKSTKPERQCSGYSKYMTSHPHGCHVSTNHSMKKLQKEKRKKKPNFSCSPLNCQNNTAVKPKSHKRMYR